MSNDKEVLSTPLEQKLGFPLPKQVLNFHPWGNKILVKRLKSEEKYKGTIYIPDSAKKMMTAGTIIKVGEDVGVAAAIGVEPTLPLGFENHENLVGLIVTFNDFAGSAAIADADAGDPYATDFLLITLHDIMGHNTDPSDKERQ